MITPSAPKSIHHGRNVKRIREILGIKQEALAAELGEDWYQRRVSALEEKEEIEDAVLEQVAKALKVPVDAIKNFNEEATIYNIQHNYEGATHNHNIGAAHNCSFNPLDKFAEVVEKNEKLYEALLKSEREKIALLQEMLKSEREKG